MNQGKYGEEKQTENNFSQGSYGTQAESWVCPACETVNSQDKCVVCGYQNEHKVDTIVSEKKRRPSPALAIAACLLGAVFLALFMLPKRNTAELPKDSNVGQITEPKAVIQETAPQARYTLMADKIPEDIAPEDWPTYPALGGKYQRQQIRSITFLTSTEDATADSWDVSETHDGTVLAWIKPNGELYDLYIGAEGGILAPENCFFLFGFYQNLNRINFNEAFDTSNVTDMHHMFYFCSSLTELDLSSFDTANVTDMFAMFHDCSSLTELNVSGFDTSNVTDMACMFWNCSSLTELDLFSFDTANVKNMRCMFFECSSLTELNLSSFDTANVTDMGGMFHDCSSLTELNVSGFDTSNVTDMGGMFWYCRSLTGLDVSSFDVSNVENYPNFMDNGRTINGRPWEEFFTQK